MKKLLLYSLIIFFFSCQQNIKESNESTSVIQYTSPNSMGMSADSLKNVEKILNEYIDEKKIPGAVVLVAKEGKIVLHEAYGFDNIAQKTAMKTNRIFRIASMTKPIVSAAVLKLYEEGKLDFSDPVSKYIPEFKDVKVLDSFNANDTSWTTKPVEKEILIHHLLTHTSGITYGFTNPTFGAIYAKMKIPDSANPFDMTIQQTVKRLAKTPLFHQPGEKWTYGLSSDVLGAVVEIVSGENLGDYVKKQILDPLKMDHTNFWLPANQAPDLASFYMPSDSGIIEIPKEGLGFFKPNFPVEGAKKYYSGGSGLSASTFDYYIFCQTILNSGIWNGTRILKEKTIDLMKNNQISEITGNSGFGFGYGFGVATKDSNDTKKIKKGKFYWGGAFGTTFWVDPERELIAILMTQIVSNPYKNIMESRVESAINASVLSN